MIDVKKHYYIITFQPIIDKQRKRYHQLLVVQQAPPLASNFNNLDP